MNTRESTWLVQAQQGDTEAFSHLVETYQTPVHNLCYRMLGNAHDAEDAAQETFFRAYKSLEGYDGKRSFVTWLLAIASHYCIDQLRKRRISTLSLDDENHTWLEPPDPGLLPESVLGMREMQVQVQILLRQLRPKDRAAVVMRYWYDYSYMEIGDALSLTVSAVKSRLHRARRELAEGWQVQQTKILTRERARNESPAI